MTTEQPIVTIPYMGRQARAVRVSFEPGRVTPDTYDLEGGTQMFVSTIVVKVFRLLDEATPEGLPLYAAETASTIALSKPMEEAG